MVRLCNETYSNDKYAPYFESYPYPLSDFQKYAIEGIVKGEHILITAHTGSGKTLPAEFAIQHFVEKGKKVIYTSPIKALSNQKFYEFTKKYPDITFGLMTGDIKTNPNADVLIMTTEILMNYLFSVGSPAVSIEPAQSQLSFQIDIETELACVIFDEVHYINDADRGQTWEQTILMLPKHIQMVMLSATIDNPQGFAEWVENRGTIVNDAVVGQGQTDDSITSDKKTVYLASTNHRVVPLTHYGFFTTTETPFKEIKDKEIQKQIRDSTNKLILLKEANGAFNEKGYYEIKHIKSLFDKHRFFMKRKFVLNKLAGYLKENEMLPAIVFVFSRKNVETCANDITTNLLEDDSKIPYIMRRECEQIVRKFPNFKEYLELPEYNELVGLLEKGIGIHHSGMIPVLREIVELMISKKYIKLLFATESFAIGLDCPIKSAVFSSLTKFDGSSMRLLMPHEYTQMAGRAGRRGLDTVGHVIHCNNLFDHPTINDYKELLCGKPQKLVSKFKISYPTILNLMKNGKMNGFHEFVDKSMLKKELNIPVQYTKTKIAEIESLYDKKTELLSMIRTPMEICREYMDMETNFQMYSQKKRKENERKMKDMKENHRWLIDDIQRLNEYNELKKSLDSEKKDAEYLENYTKIHTEKICGVLFEYGFIEKTDELVENWQLSQWGKIACNINEIHPLISTNMILKWDWFSGFSPKQLVSLFSVFTNVNVLEEYKKNFPDSTDEFVKYRLFDLQKMKEHYEDVEQKYGLNTGIHYHEMLSYDLVDEMAEWADCQTEEQCKYTVQTILSKRGISLGDFIKAVLKIGVIVKEFIGVCEMMGDTSVGLLHKLNEIEPMIMKYVATSQSLYI